MANKVGDLGSKIGGEMGKLAKDVGKGVVDAVSMQSASKSESGSDPVESGNSSGGSMPNDVGKSSSLTGNNFQTRVDQQKRMELESRMNEIRQRLAKWNAEEEQILEEKKMKKKEEEEQEEFEKEQTKAYQQAVARDGGRKGMDGAQAYMQNLKGSGELGKRKG